MGQLKTSEKLLPKALTINPNEPLAKANLLTIFKQKGDFEAAHQLIGTLSEELRQHPNIRKAIADISLAEGDSVTASHYLSELAISNPNRADSWLNWAASLKSLKFTVAPALILKRGLQFNPEDKKLWLALEQALFEMCNFKAAQKICDLHKLDTDLSNSEQLFNRQFLSSVIIKMTHSVKSDANGLWIGSSFRSVKARPTLANHYRTKGEGV